MSSSETVTLEKTLEEWKLTSGISFYLGRSGSACVDDGGLFPCANVIDLCEPVSIGASAVLLLSLADAALADEAEYRGTNFGWRGVLLLLVTDRRMRLILLTLGGAGCARNQSRVDSSNAEQLSVGGQEQRWHRRTLRI